MINIDRVAINSDYSIMVDINTSPGNHITKVLLWTMDTFKDYSKALDFSSMLDGSTNVESFFITAGQIQQGATRLDGIYFLEFTSDEEDTCSTNINKNIAVVANTTLYQECLLNKVVSLDIEGCSEVQEPNCRECQENSKDVRYISTLLKSLDISIRFGFMEETIKIFKSLTKLCDICHTCPEYGNTELIAGYNYGTINNSIILL